MSKQITIHKVAVVGLGYVGLPLACLLASKGFDVIGIDTNAEKVRRINRGVLPFDYREVGLQELFSSAKLRAIEHHHACRDADAIIIAVETPVTSAHRLNYRALRSALRSVAPHVKTGSLVVVESTLAPRTMEQLVVPLLETKSHKSAERDFLVAHCPERVSPGAVLWKLQNVTRIIGGHTAEAARRAAEIYQQFVRAPIEITDALTAEIVKTAENTYRDVQIAFANELVDICRAYGKDFWEVRRLVNLVPGRQVHEAGPGVGGHCIPKDPWLLLGGLKNRRIGQLIRTARAINDKRPHVLFDELLKRLRMKKLRSKARVAVLGVSYLPETDDARNSPTLAFEKLLKRWKVSYRLHDPFVPAYRSDLRKLIQWSSVVVVMTGHQEYRRLDPRVFQGKLVLDPRHVLQGKE